MPSNAMSILISLLIALAMCQADIVIVSIVSDHSCELLVSNIALWAPISSKYVIVKSLSEGSSEGGSTDRCLDGMRSSLFGSSLEYIDMSEEAADARHPLTVGLELAHTAYSSSSHVLCIKPSWSPVLSTFVHGDVSSEGGVVFHRFQVHLGDGSHRSMWSNSLFLNSKSSYAMYRVGEHVVVQGIEFPLEEALGPLRDPSLTLCSIPCKPLALSVLDSSACLYLWKFQTTPFLFSPTLVQHLSDFQVQNRFTFASKQQAEIVDTATVDKCIVELTNELPLLLLDELEYGKNNSHIHFQLAVFLLRLSMLMDTGGMIPPWESLAVNVTASSEDLIILDNSCSMRDIAESWDSFDYAEDVVYIALICFTSRVTRSSPLSVDSSSYLGQSEEDFSLYALGKLYSRLDFKWGDIALAASWLQRCSLVPSMSSVCIYDRLQMFYRYGMKVDALSSLETILSTPDPWISTTLSNKRESVDYYRECYLPLLAAEIVFEENSEIEELKFFIQVLLKMASRMMCSKKLDQDFVKSFIGVHIKLSGLTYTASLYDLCANQQLIEFLLLRGFKVHPCASATEFASVKQKMCGIFSLAVPPISEALQTTTFGGFIGATSLDDIAHHVYGGDSDRILGSTTTPYQILFAAHYDLRNLYVLLNNIRSRGIESAIHIVALAPSDRARIIQENIMVFCGQFQYSKILSFEVVSSLQSFLENERSGGFKRKFDYIEYNGGLSYFDADATQAHLSGMRDILVSDGVIGVSYFTANIHQSNIHHLVRQATHNQTADNCIGQCRELVRNIVSAYLIQNQLFQLSTDEELMKFLSLGSAFEEDADSATFRLFESDFSFSNQFQGLSKSSAESTLSRAGLTVRSWLPAILASPYSSAPFVPSVSLYKDSNVPEEWFLYTLLPSFRLTAYVTKTSSGEKHLKGRAVPSLLFQKYPPQANLAIIVDRCGSLGKVFNFGLAPSPPSTPTTLSITHHSSQNLNISFGIAPYVIAGLSLLSSSPTFRDIARFNHRHYSTELSSAVYSAGKITSRDSFKDFGLPFGDFIFLQKGEGATPVSKEGNEIQLIKTLDYLESMGVITIWTSYSPRSPVNSVNESPSIEPPLNPSPPQPPPPPPPPPSLGRPPEKKLLTTLLEEKPPLNTQSDPVDCKSERMLCFGFSETTVNEALSQLGRQNKTKSAYSTGTVRTLAESNPIIKTDLFRSKTPNGILPLFSIPITQQVVGRTVKTFTAVLEAASRLPISQISRNYLEQLLNSYRNMLCVPTLQTTTSTSTLNCTAPHPSSTEPTSSLTVTSIQKLDFDLMQTGHLLSGCKPSVCSVLSSVRNVISSTKSLLEEASCSKESKILTLSDSQFTRIRESLNRLFHLSFDDISDTLGLDELDEEEGRLVLPSHFNNEYEPHSMEHFMSALISSQSSSRLSTKSFDSSQKIINANANVNNVLTPKHLAALVHSLQQSTIWFETLSSGVYATSSVEGLPFLSFFKVAAVLGSTVASSFQFSSSATRYHSVQVSKFYILAIDRSGSFDELSSLGCGSNQFRILVWLKGSSELKLSVGDKETSSESSVHTVFQISKDSFRAANGCRKSISLQRRSSNTCLKSASAIPASDNQLVIVGPDQFFSVCNTRDRVSRMEEANDISVNDSPEKLSQQFLKRMSYLMVIDILLV